MMLPVKVTAKRAACGLALRLLPTFMGLAIRLLNLLDHIPPTHAWKGTCHSCGANFTVPTSATYREPFALSRPSICTTCPSCQSWPVKVRRR